MNRRLGILVVLMACLLAGWTLWSYRYMTLRRKAASNAQADVAECDRLAARIADICRLPTVAADHEKFSGEITSIIEAAAKSASVPTGRLEDIIPQPPRRVGDTVYKEKPTQVTLKGITLEQLVRLGHGVLSGKQHLNIKWINLDAPGVDDTSNFWTVELGVTYLIYDPPRAGRDRS
jgi:hypothetical protein